MYEFCATVQTMYASELANIEPFNVEKRSKSMVSYIDNMKMHAIANTL